MHQQDIPENRQIEIIFAKGNITRTIKNYIEIINDPLYFGLSYNEISQQQKDQEEKSINGFNYDYELQHNIEMLLFNNEWVKLIPLQDNKLYIQLSKKPKNESKLYNLLFFKMRKNIEIIFSEI